MGEERSVMGATLHPSRAQHLIWSNGRLDLRSEMSANTISDHFSPFSTIFSIFAGVRKWCARGEREAVTSKEVLHVEDALQDKAVARQYLLWAMAAGKSLCFQALSQGPMPKEANRKRGLAAPFRPMPLNPQGIASGAAPSFTAREK